MRRLFISGITAAVAFGAMVLGVPTEATAAGSVTATAAAAPPIKGDYATPIRYADTNKDIDVDATIAKLTGAHVNTYAYLICYGLRGGRDWNTLPAFLSAAADAGIDVWVYICPPSESKDTAGNEMPPYYLDYVQWATEIAELSVTYPNLTGWAIDDFFGNAAKYTRAYTESMVNAARAVNPAIKFRPVVYYSQLVGYSNMMGAYRYYIDGVIFPYRNDSSGTDMTNSANADPETRAVYDAISCAGSARCAHFYFPGNTVSAAGWKTSYSTTVSVNPTASSYGLTFDVWDDFTGATAGYRYARVVVDNTVVFSRDVAGTPASTAVSVSDAVLRPLLAGKSSATLRVEMYDAKAVTNFHTAVTFDSITGTGFTVTNGDFDSGTGWTPARSSSVYLYGFVPNMKPTLMTYASKLAREAIAPSPTYVGAVVDTALDLATAGITDGSLIYCLNKSGSDTYDTNNVLTSYAASYNVVASIYGAA
ncbi:hypothetical protein AB0M47_04285 [Hamadaea sp. NPDC051192]|uniref:hypothetical protein n=1 Tax=Hamadaea sp. NPDC051192 TaxID=3154940 RepID=UPI00343C8834